MNESLSNIEYFKNTKKLKKNVQLSYIVNYNLKFVPNDRNKRDYRMRWNKYKLAAVFSRIALNVIRVSSMRVGWGYYKFLKKEEENH